jgi:hypothetical protein
MKSLFVLMFSLFFISGTAACGQTTQGNQPGEKTEVLSETIDVYYFHFARRCVTCVNVQKATEKVLSEMYGKEMENGSLVYHEVNLSESSSADIATKLEVGGQALLVVSGEKKYDITMQGFMYASRDYEKFKEILESTIGKVKT